MCHNILPQRQNHSPEALIAPNMYWYKFYTGFYEKYHYTTIALREERVKGSFKNDHVIPGHCKYGGGVMELWLRSRVHL